MREWSVKSVPHRGGQSFVYRLVRTIEIVLGFIRFGDYGVFGFMSRRMNCNGSIDDEIRIYKVLRKSKTERS